MTPDYREILTKAPFHLDASALQWVEKTYQSLTLDEKIGQLMIVHSMGMEEGKLEQPVSIGAGGITRFFTGDYQAEKAVIATMQKLSKVPMLVSADLEGSIMSLPFGTQVPNPLALAAIDDLDDTRAISELMAQEAKAVGVNWSFTPVLDINAAFRSSIVATRGYGSDPERIARHAMAQLEVFQEQGIAATVKHWPGEGYDDRDQHLVTTVNPLAMDEWHKTFGTLYKAAIARDVKAIMSAHIALPSFVRSNNPDADVQEQHLPASINKHLNIDLLRVELGFNGLIVSDATPMAGLSSVSARAEHIHLVIENGCDMILFSDVVEQDIKWLKAAHESGALSEARLEAALMRILGLKASLGLHLQQAPMERPDLKAAEALVALITQKAPTLVKDAQQLLPLDRSKTRKIYVFSTGLVSPLMGGRDLAFLDMLRAEGFEVSLHDPKQPGLRKWQDYDLILYLMAEETLLTRERIFMNWAGLTGFFGAAMERPWHDVPCALISFGYPYYLYDAPRMPCVINAYMAAETAQRAVLECLMGRAPFEGRSPIDPFCGQDIARF